MPPSPNSHISPLFKRRTSKKRKFSGHECAPARVTMTKFPSGDSVQKQPSSTALDCALATHILGRPVRCISCTCAGDLCTASVPPSRDAVTAKGWGPSPICVAWQQDTSSLETAWSVHVCGLFGLDCCRAEVTLCLLRYARYGFSCKMMTHCSVVASPTNLLESDWRCCSRTDPSAHSPG